MLNKKKKYDHLKDQSAVVPSFDEIYAMPSIQKSIDIAIERNIIRHNFLLSYKDDMKQEILICLFQKLKYYDPERSSLKTFINNYIKISVCAFNAEFCRNSSLMITFAQDVEVFESESSKAKITNLDKQYYSEEVSKNSVEQYIQIKDIENVINELPRDLRKIALELWDGNTLNDICKKNSIPESTLRRNYLTPIKQFIKTAYFED